MEGIIILTPFFNLSLLKKLAEQLGLESIEDLEDAIDAMQGIATDGSELETENLAREARVRSAYLEWCKEAGKTADESRFPQFSSNYLAMEEFSTKAGKEMVLNEYADCTEEEYASLTSKPKAEKKAAPAKVEKKAAPAKVEKKAAPAKAVKKEEPKAEVKVEKKEDPKAEVKVEKKEEPKVDVAKAKAEEGAAAKKKKVAADEKSEYCDPSCNAVRKITLISNNLLHHS